MSRRIKCMMWMVNASRTEWTVRTVRVRICQQFGSLGVDELSRQQFECDRVEDGRACRWKFAKRKETLAARLIRLHFGPHVDSDYCLVYYSAHASIHRGRKILPKINFAIAEMR